MSGFIASACGCAVALAVMLLVLHAWDLCAKNSASSHDSIANLLLKLPDAPVLALLLWFVISFVVGILVPYRSDLSGFGEWIAGPYGSLTSVTYTFLVPALVAAYIELLRTVREIGSSGNLHDLGVTRPGRPATLKILALLSRAALFVLVVVITYQAVDNRIDEMAASPWVETRGEKLSSAGVFYYLLRGLNAYLAFGLFLSTAAIYVAFTLFMSKGGMTLLDKGYQPKQLVRRLTTAMAWCLFLSPVVVVLHGFALYWETPISAASCQEHLQGSRLDALSGSTWWVWAVLNFVSTCFLVVVIFRLHKCCSDELQDVERNMLKNVDEKLDAARAEGLSVAENYKVRIEMVGRLRAASASPIAVSSLLLVGASIVVQVGGIIIQIWSRWGNT